MLLYHIYHLGKLKTQTRTLIGFWFWHLHLIKILRWNPRDLLYEGISMLQWNKSSLETHVLWYSYLCPLGFAMLLYYPACCFEVKENVYFVVAAGNTKDILLEKVPCIQRTSASEFYKIRCIEKSWGWGKTLPFFYGNLKSTLLTENQGWRKFELCNWTD